MGNSAETAIVLTVATVFLLYMLVRSIARPLDASKPVSPENPKVLVVFGMTVVVATSEGSDGGDNGGGDGGD